MTLTVTPQQYVPGTAPLAHQARELARSLEMPAFALFMDPGTGKTWIAIQTIGHWYVEHRLRVVLVIGPNNGLQDTWETQIAEHLSPSVLRRVVVYQSKAKQKAHDGIEAWAKEKDAALAKGQRPPLLFVLVNIEALSHKSGADFCKFVVAWAHQQGVVPALIVDESHQAKTPGASRTKALRKVAKGTVLRRILTGTPWPHGYEDVYPQYSILDPNILGHQTAASFRAEFCVEKRFARFTKVVGYTNLAALQQRIAPYTAFARLEDCMDLPPVQGGITGKEPLIRHCDLLEEQRQIYDDLCVFYLAELRNGVQITAKEAIVRLLRLQQVIGGGVMGDDQTFHTFPSAKTNLAVEVIEGIPADQKVIVWTRFRHESGAITAALNTAGVTAVEHSGVVDKKARAILRANWQQDPALRVLVATFSTGATSFTLNEATFAVFASNPFQYDLRFQAERRNLRIGQNKPVVYYDLMARGTIDPRIFRVLRSRRSLDKLIELAPATELQQLLQDTAP